jgi:hypothetical protein
MPSGPIESEIPQPFPCLLESTMQIQERCFTGDKNTEAYVTKYGGQLTRCRRGYGWDAVQHLCFKCSINTQVCGLKSRQQLNAARMYQVLGCCIKRIAQVVVNPNSGISECKPCPDGTHNPLPARFPMCACKLHLEPRDDGTCLPCTFGHFKDAEMRHNDPCKRCPDAKKNHTEVGAKR